ncbi:hypothetical protein JMJ77_0014417 [Colletotrichum scovillei]|uniref:Uncharacterized protein n=1 Tax=Colletotrichum scovillei TaxID=1209932 RepID=A0A9P7R4W3_9PEZI|nr:hypothetical protein JMJ77_0014417 [Colletotrichum scovillei]KAG7065949.1 hypothetical protein JMJ78_0012691 [Colletotrichum scovillei]KAG7068550.1 hypothetical protein JMJ76_0008235 [Colletotrichum scovillei]
MSKEGGYRMPLRDRKARVWCSRKFFARETHVKGSKKWLARRFQVEARGRGCETCMFVCSEALGGRWQVQIRRSAKKKIVQREDALEATQKGANG